jgi:hypothetical protein
MVATIIAGVAAWRLSLHAVLPGPAVWNAGDVFAGIAGGQYYVYDHNGNLKDHIDTALGGFTTGCAFNPPLDRLYTTAFTANHVVSFFDDSTTTDHHIVADLDTSFNNNAENESIVFNTGGDFFVGHAGKTPGTNKELFRFSVANAFLGLQDPLPDLVGTDWNDLTGNTVSYTSEGFLIKSFDVGANTQGLDFTVLGPSITGNPVAAFALRRLPAPINGGVLLVAAQADIRLLDSGGNLVHTYLGLNNEKSWFALNIDPNGTSFWSGDFNTGNIYRFNIATGAVELGPINTGTGALTLFGLCVKGEKTAPTGPGFVVGDVEPHAVLDTVNFWGAQWWMNNQMSAGFSPGTAGFKGFATDSDNACGGNWKTRPGNSPPPPATIPDDLTIIVTDTVQKSGPNISGHIVGFINVHSDGKYSSDPGHRGGGVVTNVVTCPGH